MAYSAYSARLDAEILRTVQRFEAGHTLHDDEFNDLALDVFAYQLRYNAPYARYCASLGVTPDHLPATWHDIPPVPNAAFKETTLTTFDVGRAALAFVTSGTTSGTGGRHYMETPALYDAVCVAGFARFMLCDGIALRYFNLVPNPADRPESSLGYMMAAVSARFGTAETGWYVRSDQLFLDAFFADVRDAIERAQPVCIATTAFAMVQVLDVMRERGLNVTLPPGSRVMETGGFKGRARVVDRSEMYADVAERFGIAQTQIVAEYGMTELTSQWYDTVLCMNTGTDGIRYKAAPPWLRARVVGPDGKTLPDGTVGALVHVDAANRSSCIAVATEDLGVQFPDGLVLIGREAGATLRGCSLDAETLLPK